MVAPRPARLPHRARRGAGAGRGGTAPTRAMAAEEAPELGMRWIERVRADLAGNAEALATLDGFR